MATNLTHDKVGTVTYERNGTAGSFDVFCDIFGEGESERVGQIRQATKGKYTIHLEVDSDEFEKQPGKPRRGIKSAVKSLVDCALEFIRDDDEDIADTDAEDTPEAETAPEPEVVPEPEAEPEPGVTPAPTSKVSSPDTSKLQGRIASLEVQLEKMKVERDSLKREVTHLEKALEKKAAKAVVPADSESVVERETQWIKCTTLNIQIVSS